MLNKQTTLCLRRTAESEKTTHRVVMDFANDISEKELIPEELYNAVRKKMNNMSK